MLSVGGIQPFSSVDYPGRLAAVIFCQGCPWDCPYCHNPHLRLFARERSAGQPSWADALTLLQARRGLLDAVVFSGGEPLAQPELAAAMQEVRALGYAVGLHTAGINPLALGRVLPYCDWVGFDVKATAADYLAASGRKAGSVVAASLAAMIASGVDHEVRTTVDPRLFDQAALLQLATELAAAGVRRWRLQTCRGLPDSVVKPDLRSWLPELQALIADSEVR
ncbi:anaerobic ribonucleoside-triphosphate reductase activating protein [Rhodocyclus tenuis]|uniref:anaerobic ribonucleoside-triphosphate reductase activating protein n=1 Tax=Rhodocyclus tenuis TaxID=1066 RepID=UPI001908A374|nr:anaerobic ribonucleoside-triphosphate reductase activating protein [Rhodocyclus tenuis]MBK1679452.1 anaerobic ribonucleoside-triphosphate reductase activating protein [Rhodocyclus tenuis]